MVELYQSDPAVMTKGAFLTVKYNDVIC